MKNYECQGCSEYHELSRRQFMTATGGTVLLAATAPAWLPRVAFARDDCTSRDVIISIFLRGAADGLTLCVPHGENAYYTNRPTLAVPRPDSGSANSAIDLNGFFGFPQALAALVPAYQAGNLLVVHATGSTDPSRSHFDAQRFMEIGKPGDGNVFTGWLGRHLMSAPPIDPSAILRAVGIGYGLQKTLEGAPLALPIPNLDAFGLGGNGSTLAARRDAISDMYETVGDPLQAAAENTQATIDMLNQIEFASYSPAGGAVYPDTPFGISIRSTAALLRAQVGVEAVHIDVGGWDTHNNQQPLTGYMANLMADLAGGLGAFHADMNGANVTRVTVVVVSEFGRRVAENGSLGCDHGHGNCMFVMGNNINGGRVLTQWPGLNAGQLYQNLDLQVTIDFRDILAEVVQKRLGNPDLGFVFPGYAPTFRGVVADCPPRAVPIPLAG